MCGIINVRYSFQGLIRGSSRLAHPRIKCLDDKSQPLFYHLKSTLKSQSAVSKGYKMITITLNATQARSLIKVIKKASGLTDADIEYIDDISDNHIMEMLKRLIKMQMVSEV